MTLDCVHDGFDIPEYGVRVRWLVTRGELCDAHLPGVLSTPDGGWPLLRFTCLGVAAAFRFNFVTHPESRLLGLRSDDATPEDIDRVFRGNAATPRDRLGEPNEGNWPDSRNLMWRDGRVRVHYWAGERDGAETGRRHSLSVSFHAGKPRAWVPPLNYEHDDGKIVGHITRSRVTADGGTALDDETVVDALPAKFHTVNAAVLYKHWQTPELQERMDTLLAEIVGGGSGSCRWNACSTGSTTH